MSRNHSLALWGLIAVVSPTSEIVCKFVTGAVPDWLLWARISVLATILVASVFANRIRFLWPFCLAYLYQLTLVAAREIASNSGEYHSVVSNYDFIGKQLFLQSILLLLHVPVIVWFLRTPDRFYFRIGNLTAPLEISGQHRGGMQLRWQSVGLIFAVVSALTAWMVMGYEGQTASPQWGMAPWAVLFAAANSFSEEFLYRNILVSAVRPAFGTRHAVFVSAAIFGIGHWNGLPSGFIGVVMTFVLGYVTARALVETRGMFWPWFMHLLPDCVLFYYWGIGAVAHQQLG